MGARRGARRAIQRSLQRSLQLSLLILTACTGSDFPPEPSVDEEGLAVLGGLEYVASQARCTDVGLLWSSWDADDAPITLARSTGTAGIVSSLLEGAEHFALLPLSDDETDQQEPLRWLSLARSGADSLTALAQAEPDGSLSWPSCISLDDGPNLCEGPLPTSSSCSEADKAPLPGLSTGVAGIGLTLLELSAAQSLWESWSQALNEEAPFEPLPQLCAWQADAEAAGQWLLQQQCSSGGWASQGSCDDGVRATGLGQGAAGIGYFFLRLYERTGDVRWRDAAEDSARWLRLLSRDPKGDGLTLAIPAADGSDQLQTGLGEGNAGILVFLLSLAQVERADAATAAATGLTGEASLLNEEAGFNQALAEGIVAWLLSSDMASASLTGLVWPISVRMTESSSVLSQAPTGLWTGQAGIGWALLRAAQAEVPGALEGAEGSARWLAHALNAHYYQGRTWWPEHPEGISDDVGSGDAADALNLEPSQTGGPITWHYLPGLEEGIAGIAWFMRDLARETGATCWEKLSDEASHWLYLRGRPSGQDELWRWPEEATRQRGEDLLIGRFSAPLGRGTAGVTRLLAYDRLLDQTPGLVAPPSLWGLRPLSGDVPARLTCNVLRGAIHP